MGLMGVETNNMSSTGQKALLEAIVRLGSQEANPQTDITVQSASSTAPGAAFANLVEQEMARPDGLRRIAFAMHPVLKMRLDYHAIGRQNCLIVDEITTGDVPFYDLDMAESVAVAIAGRGEPIQHFSNVKRVQFPTGAISHVHQVDYQDIAIRRYALFDRAKERVAIGLAIAEDDAIFGSGGVIPAAAALSSNTPIGGSSISRYILAELYGSIVQNQLALGAYLMHPVLYKDILKWSANELDQVTLNKITESGMVGGYFGAKLLLSTRCSTTACYAMTTADKLGRLPERKAVEVKVFDNVERLRYAILGWEQVGFGVFNTKGVAVANIS